VCLFSQRLGPLPITGWRQQGHATIKTLPKYKTFNERTGPRPLAGKICQDNKWMRMMNGTVKTTVAHFNQFKIFTIQDDRDMLVVG